MRRVLDWCHAVHHISLALEGLGLEATARRQLFKDLRRKLRRGGIWSVIAQLGVLAVGKGKGQAAAVWREIRYLDRHAWAGHRDYRSFRQEGLPLGSGAIESAVRRVVNLRLKGPGVLWDLEKAEGMLVLRAAVLTRQWRETLQHVREVMATDRRLNWKWGSPDMPAQLKAQLVIGPPTPELKDTEELEEAAA